MNDEKTKSVISYIVFICAVIFLVQKDSSRDLKFNCAQSIVIFAAFLILSIFMGFISGILGIGLISRIPYLAYIAGIVYACVKAYNGENAELPVIGNIAKSIFGKQIEK